MNTTGKIPALAVRLIAALITLYLYFNPTALAHAEYSLGIDGIVGRSACSSRSGKSSTSPKIFSRKTKIDEGGSQRLPPSSIQKTSHRVRASHGAKKFRSVFGGVYVVKNTLRGAECRRPAYGGSRRRAERNPLVKKAAPF